MSNYSPDYLATLFVDKQPGTTLFVFDALPSTNAFALQCIRHQGHDGTVVIADHQSAGRGRLNRQWFSPPGLNIYLSLVKRIPNGPIAASQTGWLPLIAGLAIAQSLETVTQVPLGLKWPNDLIIDDKKVGGLLCESTADRHGDRWLVIGCGINVNQPQTGFPPELQATATSLLEASGQTWDRAPLLPTLCSHIEVCMTICMQNPHHRPSPWQSLYQQRCTTIGQVVEVQFPDNTQLTGQATGIGPQGQLQILPLSSNTRAQPDKIRDVHAGDIRHLRLRATP